MTRYGGIIIEDCLSPGAFPAHRRASSDEESWYSSAELRSGLFLFAMSTVVLSVVAGAGQVGSLVATTIALVLGAVALVLSVLRRGEAVMTILGYLIAVEPMSRRYAPSLGYLYVEYLIISIAIIFIFLKRGRWRPNNLVLGVFLLIEVIDLIRLPAIETLDLTLTRGILLESAAKLGIIMIASRVDPGSRGIGRAMLSFLIGTSSMSVILGISILTGNVKWNRSANLAASGGMGPNQIGNLLAFGAFTCLVASNLSKNRSLKLILTGLTGLQTLVMLLTFTRGSAVALAIGVLFYSVIPAIRRPGSSAQGLFLLVFLALITVGAVFFTDSMLIARFQKKGVSHRDTIVQGAFEIFRDNPLFGIGTGNFYAESAKRDILHGSSTGAHNEIMRTMAEHGLLGLIVYLIFLGLCFKQSATGRSGAARTATMIWFSLYLYSECHSGLKLASQSFMLALACEAFRKPS